MMDWRPLRALYRLQICIYLFPIIHCWQWVPLYGATCSSRKIPIDTPGAEIEQRLCFEHSTFWSLYHIWRRTERKVTAPSYWRKPVEVVQVSVRMAQQHLPLEISLILPRGKRSCGQPRSYWRDYIFDPVWVELDSVSGWRDVWNTLLNLLQQWPIWKNIEEDDWMDGWIHGWMDGWNLNLFCLEIIWIIFDETNMHQWWPHIEVDRCIIWNTGTSCQTK